MLSNLWSGISIHALREEGDTKIKMAAAVAKIFLSTPSARRATVLFCPLPKIRKISIHALREEGDGWEKYKLSGIANISIHALREEGDSKNRDKISIFL